MQTSLDSETLETLYSNATTARRLASYIEPTPVVDTLTREINELVYALAELLGKPLPPRPTELSSQSTDEQTKDGAPEFSLANAVDDLRQLIARADAIANAAETTFDALIWAPDEDDRLRIERLAHLVSATSDAVRDAAEAGDQLAADLITRA